MSGLLRPADKRAVGWIALALLVKGLFLAWYVSGTYYHDIPGFVGQSNGDMMTYIQPVEKLLATGDFATDDRMPGYPAVYYVLRRLKLDPPNAANAMLVLQWLLSGVSVYVLGRVAQRLFVSEKAFYWAYFIYLFSTFVSVFDAFFLTESFAASATVFFLAAWLRFSDERSGRRSGGGWLVLAGAWLAWSVFLKPAHLPLLAVPPFILGLDWLRKRLTLRSVFQYSLLFLLPFLLADAAWTYRNYRRYGEVIPLLKSPWYPASFWPTNYFDMMAFCQTYGEEFGYWFPNAGIRWMMGFGPGNFVPPARWFVPENLGPPPRYVYTSAFNADSLTQLRTLYYEAVNNPALDSTTRNAYYAEAGQKWRQYAQSVRNENPLVYYVWAPLRYTFTFLNGTWGYSFLDDMIRSAWPRTLLRVYHYVLVLLPGLVGLVLLTVAGFRRNARLLVVPLPVGICLFIYVIILRHPETRYLAPFYPLLVLAAVYAFLRLRLPTFAR